METQRIIQQFQQLPAEAQRIVAELIALLSQQSLSPTSNSDSSSVGATILPPLDLSNEPTTWPENEFMNPEFYGVWADREDMKDGGAAYIHRVRRGLQPPRP